MNIMAIALAPLVVVFLLSACAFSWRFRCPGDHVDGFPCNGHGQCSNDNRCVCNEGWWSQSVDCSLRECKSGPAWASKPYALDKAHSSMECSNAGLCNRYTGICDCFDGFTGQACERLACEDNCSNRGECLTIYDLYRFRNYQNESVYTLWDKDKIQGCVCDYGYTGSKCDMKMCPKGVDPLSQHNGTHSIIIETSTPTGFNTGAFQGFGMYGKFRFTFNGKSFYFDANATVFSADDCANAFSKLPNIKSVTCSQSIQTEWGGGATYYVNFTSFPIIPYENNLWSHNGVPDIDSFYCDTSQVNVTTNRAYSNSVKEWPVTCAVSVKNYGGSVPKYDYCSNRGLCDFNTGECDCALDFYGVACNRYDPNPLIFNNTDIMRLESSDSAFTGTVLHLTDTMRGEEEAWNALLFEANEYTYDDNRTQMFAVNAYGDVQINGGIELNAIENQVAVQIADGGLMLQGGLTIDSGGMTIANDGAQLVMDTNLTVRDGLTVHSNGMSIYAGGLVVNSGGITIEDGGIVIPDCMTYASVDVQGKCYNPLGMTVGAGGMSIMTGGMVIDEHTDIVGGIFMERLIDLNGLTVNTGGLGITSGGMTVKEIGLVIDRYSEAYQGVTVIDGMTSSEYALNIDNGGVIIDAGGLSTTGGMTVSANGVTAAARTDVISEGLYIYKGGFSVQDTTLDVTGGLWSNGRLTIHDTGLRSTGGVLVSGGLVVTGGLSLKDSNLVVSMTDAVTVNGGLKVTGGLSLYAGAVNLGHAYYPGLQATGGISVKAGGIVSAAGLTVKAGGLTVASASYTNTIGSGGLAITDGITVSTGGITAGGGVSVVTDGITVTTGGVDIDGGLHTRDALVHTDQLLVTTTGVNILRGFNHSYGTTHIVKDGLQTTGRSYINNMGLVVTGGASIASTGIHTSDGLSVLSDGLILSSALSSEFGRHYISQFTAVDGVDISAGGASVKLTSSESISAQNFTISDGLWIEGDSSQGVMVTAGGVTIKDAGMRIHSHVLGTGVPTVKNGASVITLGGMTVTQHGMTVDLSDSVSASTKTQADEAVFQDGVTVHNTGVYVHAGGLKIGDVDQTDFTRRTGLWVTGAMTVYTEGIEITNPTFGSAGMEPSLDIQSGGIVVNAGVFKSTTGLSVEPTDDDPGIKVLDTGLTVTDGMTIYGNLGLISAAKFHIDDGLVITGGMTVSNVGMDVTGGVTVVDGLLHMERSGASNNLVSPSGITTAGGLSVTAGGLVVAQSESAVTGDGMTISAGGLTISAGVATVANEFSSSAIVNTWGGLGVSTDGFTITAGGLVIDDGHGTTQQGITISADGLVVGGTAQDVTFTDHGVDDNTRNTIYYSGTISASDRRLKQNVTYIASQNTKALDNVKALKGVYFNWNDEYYNVQKRTSSPRKISSESVDFKKYDKVRKAGLLAQDVASVVPEAILYIFNEAYLGVRYLSVLPTIIEAVKSLSRKFELLTTFFRTNTKQKQQRSRAEVEVYINRLKEKVTMLESKMHDIQERIQ